MQMRMPAIPLITVDPYFSVWSRDRINECWPEHWTGSRNAILGTVTVDGEEWRFLGRSGGRPIPQVGVEAEATSTKVTFANEQIELTALFTSPLLITDLYLCSRPVSYLKLSWRPLDGRAHTVTARVTCGEELVLNKAGEGRAWSEPVALQEGAGVRMGNGEQKVLWRCGDDLRIDWGYLYLAVKGQARVGNTAFEGLYGVWAQTELKNEALFAFAYDDIQSIRYFGRHLPAYWKKGGKTIAAAIDEALADYDRVYAAAHAFSEKLTADAVAKGGERYAELLSLAYRQVMAAHKLVEDGEGQVLYISKECFSNACAATVDVTYPSAPLFLLYNPELLKGMLRPIMRFARSDAWQWDFAPHDAGCYPHVDGQVYAAGNRDWQMPVEECGNLIILCDAIARAENDASFAKEHLDLLSRWYRYLIEYGEDPENQICTDDFAGHLAHNCNLSLKAVMGIAGYADILARLGRETEAAAAMEKARAYAASFLSRAKNEDGSWRLAYDRPGTFSLKYNAVWDKLWKTALFPPEFFAGEIARYRKEALPYGVPLDSREKYTKSDWTLWVACMGDEADFRFFTDLLWRAYHTMRSRVPMTDWYYADTSEMVGFRHRTVQGGLFLRLMME